jgi:hypothetical protein
MESAIGKKHSSTFAAENKGAHGFSRSRDLLLPPTLEFKFESDGWELNGACGRKEQHQLTREKKARLPPIREKTGKGRGILLL